MYKAVPFIETMGSDKFKRFILEPFHISLLCKIVDTDEPIFSQWRGKNMGSWYKFVNDDEVVLEFYLNLYNIINNNKRFTLPLPLTLDDFIIDMKRFNVQLFWNDTMDIMFEPKEYLHKDDISAYFVNLLGLMDKSNELLL